MESLYEIKYLYNKSIGILITHDDITFQNWDCLCIVGLEPPFFFFYFLPQINSSPRALFVFYLCVGILNIPKSKKVKVIKRKK